MGKLLRIKPLKNHKKTRPKARFCNRNKFYNSVCKTFKVAFSLATGRHSCTR